MRRYSSRRGAGARHETTFVRVNLAAPVRSLADVAVLKPQQAEE